MNESHTNSDFCCACLKVCEENNEAVNLNFIPLPFEDISYKVKLKYCVPEMVLEYSEDYMLCNSCLTALDTAYSFRCMCLRSESKLEEFRSLKQTHNEIDEKQIKQEAIDSFNKDDLLDRSEVSDEYCDMVIQPQLPDLIAISEERQEAPIEIVKNELGSLLTESLSTASDDTSFFSKGTNNLQLNSNYRIFDLFCNDSKTVQNQNEEIQQNLTSKNKRVVSDLEIMEIACKTIPELHNCAIESLQCQVALEKISVLESPVILPNSLKMIETYESISGPRGRLWWCNICKKYIARRDRFNAHILRHSNIKAYKCKRCSMRFFSNDAVYSHNRKCREQQGISASIFSDDDLKQEIIIPKIVSDTHVISNKTISISVSGDTVLTKKDSSLSETDSPESKPQSSNVPVTNITLKEEIADPPEIVSKSGNKKKTNPKGTKKRRRSNLNSQFKVFGNRRSKRSALRKREPLSLITCELCDYETPIKYKYDVHMLKHINKKSFECSDCPKRFSERWLLTQHIRRKHSEVEKKNQNSKPPNNDVNVNDHPPSIKSESWESNSSTSERVVTPIIQSIQSLAVDRKEVKKSEVKKSEVKTFPCKLCCKVNFESENLLLLHLKMHKDEFMCVACNKVFTSEEELQNHQVDSNLSKRESFDFHELPSPIVIKYKRKKFFCTICNLEFSTRDHENTHTGARPYKCKVCGKHFGAYSTLRRHKLIHTKSGPATKPQHFICEVCEKIFKSQEEVYSHKCQNASGEAVYRCQICKHAFIGRGALVEHMRLHITEGDDK